MGDKSEQPDSVHQHGREQQLLQFFDWLRQLCASRVKSTITKNMHPYHERWEEGRAQGEEVGHAWYQVSEYRSHAVQSNGRRLRARADFRRYRTKIGNMEPSTRSGRTKVWPDGTQCGFKWTYQILLGWNPVRV